MDQKSERRNYHRRKGSGPVLYADYGTERYRDAMLADYGIGGMAFLSDKALSPGGDICVRMEGRLPAGYGAKLAGGLRAEVIWCNRQEDFLPEQYQVGVEYYEPAVTYQDRPWQRSYDDTVPKQMTYEPVCLPEFLVRAAARFPDRPAVTCGHITLTYAELEEAVGRLATCLTAFGIQKGDHVAVLLPNLIPAVAAYVAILKIGAVAVSADPNSSDQTLAGQFRDVGVRALICLDDDYDRMLAIRQETGIRQIIFSSETDHVGLKDRISLFFSGTKKGVRRWGRSAENTYQWKRVMSDYSVNPPNTRLAFQDQAVCFFTADAYGNKRRIRWISHGHLSRQIQQLAAWFAGLSNENEKILAAAPFHELFGLLWGVYLPICRCWQTVLAPRAGVLLLPAVIRRVQPTLTPLPSDFYAQLLKHPDFDGRTVVSVKLFISDQPPFPMGTVRAWADKTGRNIIAAYGLADCYPVTHLQPKGTGLGKIGSIGIPIPDMDCRIVDMENTKIDVPVGKPGELIIKRHTAAMDTDWDGLRTDQRGCTPKNTWRKSGDIVRMDEDGFFYLLGKK